MKKFLTSYGKRNRDACVRVLKLNYKNFIFY